MGPQVVDFVFVRNTLIRMILGIQAFLVAQLIKDTPAIREAPIRIPESGVEEG